MEYFKFIHHAGCIWIEVKSLQTCSYTGNIPPNLWNSKQYVRNLIPDTTNLHAHKMSASTTSSHVKQITLLVIRPSLLFHECKKDLRFPLNNIWLKLGSLRTYKTITLATKFTTMQRHQAQRRSILPTLIIPWISVLHTNGYSDKGIKSNRIYGSQITYIPADVTSGWPEKSDKKCLATVYILSYVFSVRRALVNVVMNSSVPKNTGNFLTSWKPVSLSRRTLLHGVSSL